MSMKTASDVTLSLTADQALVLFEWLTREDGKVRLPTEHLAEQAVLWDIEAQLERVLVAPFQADYVEKVSAARERIAAAEES
jgi:hypothetical protein